MRRTIVVLAGVLMLAVVNFSIYQREQLLTHGRVVLLELAPVDPRSLMQGDYMALDFKVAREAFPRIGGNKLKNELKDGYLVVALNEHGVGNFKRMDDGTPLAKNEMLLRYRIRDGKPKFATNAFFFEEGRAQDYAGARYGEFRVSNEGEMMLTTLREPNLKRIGVNF